MIAYGLALNCSLDALVVMPYFLNIVMNKSIKQVYKDRGIYRKGQNQDRTLYRDNNLDLGLFKDFITEMYNALIAFIFGFMAPWLPFVYSSDISNTAKNGLLNPFYDHIQRSLYSSSFINPNSPWIFMFSNVKEMEIPFFVQFAFILLSNAIAAVIMQFIKSYSFKQNKKRQLLTILIILMINFFAGNPKMQSVHGNFMQLSLIQILLFTDSLSVVAIIAVNGLIMINLMLN